MSRACAAQPCLATRRAFGLVVMSALVPGSAQYVAGHRRLGRLALGIWMGAVGAVVLVGLGLLFLRHTTVGFLLTPAVAGTLRVLAWALFAGWVALLLDAWRLAAPLRITRGRRLALTAAVLVLGIVAGAATNYVANAFVAAQNLGDVLRGGGDGHQKAGRYNVLLIGADAAASREGLRPDSLNVASIDAETGRTVVFGLPRNMQRVPFPESNPLHERYPDGFVCDEGQCMLNEVWTEAEDHKDLFGDVDEPGLQTTKDVVSEVLGLELNYYAMVDMGGFKSIVDAMGGITLDLNKAIPMGGGATDVHGYIGPGTNLHLDGYHALWVARSRHDSNDYERMVRQKCVMSAMAKQLDPGLVATKFVELSQAGKDILRTDVGPGQVTELAELALRGKSFDIVSVNFAPPLIPSTANPDFAMIRQKVADEVAAAEQLDEGAAPPPLPTTPPPTAAVPTPTAPATSATPTAPATSPTPTVPSPTASPPTAAPTPRPPAPTASEPAEPLETDADGEPAWVCRVSR